MFWILALLERFWFVFFISSQENNNDLSWLHLCLWMDWFEWILSITINYTIFSSKNVLMTFLQVWWKKAQNVSVMTGDNFVFHYACSKEDHYLLCSSLCFLTNSISCRRSRATIPQRIWLQIYYFWRYLYNFVLLLTYKFSHSIIIMIN